MYLVSQTLHSTYMCVYTLISKINTQLALPTMSRH